MKVRARVSIQRPFGVLIAFALVLPTFVFDVTDVSATYDCFTQPVYGHCYSLNQWNGYTLGGYTHVSLLPLSVDTHPGRMTSEMWILSNQCRCWEEAGYNFVADVPGVLCHNYETYFHAEMKADGTYNDNCTDLGTPSSADYNRGDIGIEIWTDPSWRWWAIYIYGASGARSASADNQFFPFYQQVGMEISGTSGAHAYVTWFGSSEWLDPSYGAHFQTTPMPYGPTGGDTGNYQNVNVPSVIDGNWDVRLPSVNNDGGIWQSIPRT